MSRSSSWWVLAGSLALSGCYGAPKTPYVDAHSAIDALQSQTSCSRAVQGEAALSFEGRGRRLRGKVLYLARPPEQVRFDLLSPFGVTLSTLTSDGTRFSLYNLQERSFVYGPARTCNLQKFTQVPIPAMALVELLRGRPPILTHDPAAAVISYRRQFLSRGHYEIEVEGAHEARERILIGLRPEDYAKPPEEQRLRLLGVNVEQQGRSLYRVELSGHESRHRAEVEPSPEQLEMGILPQPPSGPACDAELPGKIVFSVPEKGYRLTLTNEEVFHNPPLSPGSFQQNRPSGVQFFVSDCQ